MGKTIHALHDAAGNRIAEYDYDESLGTSTLIREDIWADGMVVAVVEAGQMYFVRTDHIGRPVFATDDLGAVVWEASYLPFGGVQTSTGANANLRFPGQWFQSETGLHQNWMRDYDPTTGRYLQADPLGLVDGASIYGYALQNPGRYIDPRGEFVMFLPYLPAAAGIGAAIICYFLCEPAIDVVVDACGMAIDVLFPPILHNEGQPPYAGATPDDRPGDFRPVRGGGRENINDGSFWDRDHSGHGGSNWKRWPSRKNRDRYGDRDRESVRPDGSVR